MEKPKFVYVTYINTTAQKLWDALTKAEFTKQYWFDSSIESDWKVGGSVRFRRGGEVTHDQVVLKHEPPRLLAYSWKSLDPDVAKEKPSRVTFEIEALDKGVKLTVTHDDFAENSEVFKGINQGWPMVLSSLKTFLETGASVQLGAPTCGSQDQH
jgi:uncharacterized protein YndB with AHSA1/START domain